MPGLGFSQMFSAFIGEKFNLDLFEIFAIFVGGIVVILFLVVTIILNHHWGNYGVTKSQIKKLRIIYFVISGILLTTMVASFIILLV